MFSVKQREKNVYNIIIITGNIYLLSIYYFPDIALSILNVLAHSTYKIIQQFSSIL